MLILIDCALTRASPLSIFSPVCASLTSLDGKSSNALIWRVWREQVIEPWRTSRCASSTTTAAVGWLSHGTSCPTTATTTTWPRTSATCSAICASKSSADSTFPSRSRVQCGESVRCLLLGRLKLTDVYLATESPPATSTSGRASASPPCASLAALAIRLFIIDTDDTALASAARASRTVGTASSASATFCSKSSGGASTTSSS